MSTQKLAIIKDDENPKKRISLLEGGSRAATPTPSHLTMMFFLSTSCRIYLLRIFILSSSTVKACREGRSNESLDQTRTGTIVFSSCSATTALSLYDSAMPISTEIGAMCLKESIQVED
jgi:hypothetical protein